MKKPLLMDLFAGCGGLSLGLENAGFYPIFVNEINDSALGTYLKNRQHINPLLAEKYHSKDIKEMILSPAYLDDLKAGFRKDYGTDSIDLIVGGPPCQGFSGIGHRRSYSVEKKQLPSNHLYQDMAYVVGQIRPKIFLFENVRGLLSSRWTKSGEKGEIWEDVKFTFGTIPGYSIRHKLVYAKDYGVPQNRPRILLVGIRDDLLFSPNDDAKHVAGGFLHNPIRDYPDLKDLLGDLVDSEFNNGGVTEKYPSAPQNSLQRELRRDPVTGKTSRKGARLTEQEYSKHSPHVIEKFSYMIHNNGKIPPSLKTKKFAQRLLPETWDDRGPTITATSLPDDYVHFSQPRVPTVREWARLQLFPDWYIFKGKRTTGGTRRAGNPLIGDFDRELPKYTQIGNAVPVRLAEEVGKHFLKILKK